MIATNNFKSNIKNIILDVGMVLIGYCVNEATSTYGMSLEEARDFNEMIFTNPLWQSLDRGVISFEDAHIEYVHQYPELKDKIDYFFNIIDKDVSVARPRVYECVEKLMQNGYGIYILSNYSEHLFPIHSAKISFYGKINGAVISYQVQKIKPEPEIYMTLLNKYSLNPRECLFIDDNPLNTKAASELSIFSKTVNTEDDVIAILSDLL